MRTQDAQATPFSTLGHRLVDELGVPEQTLNLLFAALLLTVLGTFIGGKLLLLNAQVFWHSALITLPCLGLILLFYSLSRHLGSLPWGLTLTYGALGLLVYVRLPGLAAVSNVLFAMAALYAVRFLRVERRHWWLVFLMAVIGTATVLGVERAYTTFDMMPRLVGGSVHQDTLYHASIAAMIKNYGVVSTGLHGLVETPYHVLSHVLMAGISRLSGVGVMEVYGVANWILFAPLLLFCVAATCAMLDRAGQLSAPLVWGITALLLATLPFLFRQWALFDSFFVSESYLVSLGLFLLGLGLLFKRRLTLTDLLLVALSALLIANAKASVGLIYSGLWLVRILFLRREHWGVEVSAFLSSVLVVSWSVSAAAQASAGAMPIDPLHFVVNYSLWGRDLGAAGHALLDHTVPPTRTLLLGAAALAGFVVFHFVLSWVAVIQIAYRQGLTQIWMTPMGIYSLGAIAAGLLITFSLAIPGGSAYYFSNVAFFVSLPAVVAMLTMALMRYGTDRRLLLGFGILLIGWVSFPTYLRHSFLDSSYTVRQENLLISQLLRIKEQSPPHLVLMPNETLRQANPVERCTARPFVFPAVSERAWADVIEDANGDCRFSNYAYGQYGITQNDSRAKVPVRLLPGMSVAETTAVEESALR
jgi:hypothetical protein